MATILVVDDDRLIRTMMENCLRNAGHAVMLATNGNEALQMLREHCLTKMVDIVILDMNMPQLDGWTAASIIRKEFGEKPPIIAYSSYALAGDRARALSAGCCQFLEKPVDAGILMETLDKSLELSNKA